MASRSDGNTRVAVADWMTRLRAALFEAVTEDDVREIARGLVEKAKGGDAQATRLLFSYVLGGTSVNVKQAVIMQGQPLSPLPAAPLRSLPGTDDKVRDMARRAAAGQDVFDVRDKRRA